MSTSEDKTTEVTENIQEAGKAAGADISAALENAKNKEAARPEISGMAIARMMGVATTVELKLLEGKLDLLSGKLNTIVARTEKIVAQFNQMPTGSDLERIDVQIGALKALIKDLAVLVGGGSSGATASAKLSSKLDGSGKVPTEIIEPEEENKDGSAA